MFSKQGFITVCLVILVALLVTGCFAPTTPTPVAVTGVTLDQATMPLTVGGATGTLVATVAPATATNKSVTWSSSAPAVATVANGVVTPLTVGTATITVTTVDGGLTATCVVTVTITPVVVPPAPVVPTVVNLAAIPGVTAPVTGATPVTTITATTQYTGTVTWSPVAATFAGATVYTATITLTAKTGYTLTGLAANFFTVAGATSDTNPANSGVVTAVFPVTATVINIAAIPGVTAPVTGAVPDTTIIATAQYTGTVSWSPADNPFKGGQVYTATITLTAKTGYTLTGVAANFFTVAGVTSDTNPANSGVVTAIFPATAAAVINITAIPGVTPPVTGATPVTTITETAQYTGLVAWNTDPATFAGATVYTATITLTAKTGYTLTGVTADFFTVAGATPVTNLANSGVVIAIFPATAATIATAAIAGVTAPVTGAIPVATIADTTEYTAMIAWNGSPATFAASTVYTATITLTAKTGYTLMGVPVNFFTVADATSDTNPVNSGVVTAVFPATAAAPSATVGNVEVDGMVGSAITAKDVIITLANDTVAAEIAINTDLAGWITNLPAGLTAKAKVTVAAGATAVTIEIAGTPTATLSAAMAITIPHASLTISTSNLTVTANADAKFAIVADILISPSTVTVTNGSPFTIAIVVENVTELQGVEVELAFDNSKITYASAAVGAFLPAPIFLPPSAGSVTNQVLLSIAGTGGTPYSSGTGTVITVTFNAIAITAGTTDITFYSTELRHDTFTLIPHVVKNGCIVTVN